MADLGLKPKNRKKFLKEEYPYNLIATIIDESVWELDLPTEMTEDHLAGLAFAISQLDGREQTIIRMRFEERQTYAQIGEHLGISLNRVSQVARKALRKLYHPRNLKYYKYGLEGHKVRQAEFEDAERKRAYTDKVMATTIYDLDFSVRTFNNLIRANCGNVGDLVALSEEDILNLKNMGKKQLAEVALKLKALGLLHTAWEKFVPEEKI